MTEMVKKVAREDKIRISDEVIATIAGIAASEVKGVTSLSGGIADGIASMLGRKNLGKGVKVEMGEKEVVIDLSIIVEYGSKIHIVAKDIQSKVREVVEDMTGLTVVEINVSVLGVNIDKDLKKTDSKEKVEEITLA
jgi:uncharacterized alkaline shock family protein YloU